MSQTTTAFSLTSTQVDQLLTDFSIILKDVTSKMCRINCVLAYDWKDRIKTLQDVKSLT